MSDILVVDRLTVELPPGSDRRYAVEDVSFSVAPGEIVCVVGESGSGKSVSSFTVMGLLPREVKPVAGSIRLEGEDLMNASEKRYRELRGSRMAMIFQEPMTALNPVKTIGDQIEEVLKVHTQMSQAERRARVMETIGQVNLPDSDQIVRAYRVGGVPTLAIDGKYLTSASMAGSHEAALKTADELIAKVRQGKAKG